MKYLRVVDQAGNRTDYEAEVVPRVGERILLSYGRGSDPVRPHYFRVKDVLHRLDNEPGSRVAVLVAEENNAEPWPE